MNTELDRRREQFYLRADEFTNGLLGDHSEAEEKSDMNSANTSALETIDSMIFHAIKAHNCGDFPTAEALYTKILNQNRIHW